MNCRKCGAELPENAEYCPRCGAEAEPQDDSEMSYESEEEVEYPSPLRIKIYYILACAGVVIATIGRVAYWFDIEVSSGHHYGPGKVKLFHSIFDFCANIPEWIPEMISTVFFTLLVWEFRRFLFQYQLSKELKKWVQIMLFTAVIAIIWNLVTEVIDDFIIIYVGYSIISALWMGCGLALRKSEITSPGTWLLSSGIASFAMSICVMIFGLMDYIGSSDSETIAKITGVVAIISAVCDFMVYLSMGRYLIDSETDEDDEVE